MWVKISKEKTDPLCLRVSVGGTKEVGYYLVYRGDNEQKIEDMLVATLKAFKEMRTRKT
jgi:hypothetical protein